MQKAGLFLVSLVLVFYFLVIAGAVMTTSPLSGITLIVAGIIGLIVAQVGVDHYKSRKEDHPRKVEQ